MRKCDTCGNEYKEEWWFSKYKLEKGDCRKCYLKKYCIHKLNVIDDWIKQARENYIRTKDPVYRELLRDNQSYKKRMLKDHLKWCCQ